MQCAGTFGVRNCKNPITHKIEHYNAYHHCDQITTHYYCNEHFKVKKEYYEKCQYEELNTRSKYGLGCRDCYIYTKL